jgi:LysW-gamma-L-lysine carboxypeptidase
LDQEASVQLLQEMLQIYSPSGKEQKLATFLQDKLVGFGFENVRTDEAGNVYGEYGSGTPTILLCGHMDTVQGWISVKKENNWLHGRGAVDAKSSLAAMVSASSDIKSNLNEGRVIVTGVVEEEKTSKGIRQLLREKINVDYAIFGEPSGAKNITFAYKGKMDFRIKCKTTSGHVGAQHLLENAVEKGFELWNKIRTACTEYESPEGMFYSVTPCLTKISSQRTSGGIPDVCLFNVDVRLPPSVKTNLCEDFIKKVIDDFRSDNPKVSVASKVLDKVEPFAVDRTTLLVKALEKAIVEVTGGPVKFLKKTGTGDMNIFGAETGVPSITYGPGDSRVSHTKYERIELSEYAASIQVYKRMIENLLTWHK